MKRSGKHRIARAIVAGFLLVGLGCASDSGSITSSDRPDREKEAAAFISTVEQAITDQRVPLTNDGRTAIREFVVARMPAENSLIRIDMDKAMASASRFGQALARAAQFDGSVGRDAVNSTTVWKVTQGICPLYPFC